MTRGQRGQKRIPTDVAFRWRGDVFFVSCRREWTESLALSSSGGNTILDELEKLQPGSLVVFDLRDARKISGLHLRTFEEAANSIRDEGGRVGFARGGKKLVRIIERWMGAHGFPYFPSLILAVESFGIPIRGGTAGDKNDRMRVRHAVAQ